MLNLLYSTVLSDLLHQFLAILCIRKSNMKSGHDKGKAYPVLNKVDILHLR